MNLNNYLSKLDFKMRKLDLQFSILGICLRSHKKFWGLSAIKISFGTGKTYSLLEFIFSLPDQTTSNKFSIHSIDLLFLKTPIRNFLENHHEKKLWSLKKTRWDKFLDTLYSF